MGFVAGAVAIQAAPVAASTVVSTTYSYTGTTTTFTVPGGVTSMTVTLKGAQGGLGGGDSQGSPIPGGYQGVVTGVIAVTPGDVLTVAVGGGGATGVSSGGSAAGGSGGQNPLAGYDGSVGGVSGPEGGSGGGGGSGAASVLKIGSTEIVAGGAGGNGGNGQFYPIVGRRAEETHTPRADQTSTTGRPGMNTVSVCSPGFRCDGGASGAGGGGEQGGEQGAVQYGGATATEYFGFGGYPGANATAGFAGLTASYDYYEGNNAHGSIIVAYDDGAPGAPLNLSGTAATAAVHLSWNAPSSSGSSAISDFKVEYATSSGGPFTTFVHSASTALTSDVTGLTNGVTYFFRVTAINDEGAGAPATTSIGIMPSDVPARPVVTGVVPFGAGIHVDFTPGASHSPITGYEYRLDEGDWTTGSVSANRLTVSGLTNGQPYAAEIRARNVIGVGAPSTPPQSATPIDVAPAPTALLAVTGNGSVDLTWAAPTVDNGSAVTDYIAQTATSIDGPYTTFVDSTSPLTMATITGLTNGTTYYLRVAAVNAIGFGPWSNATVATPYTSPNAPAIALTPGDGALTVDITAGFNGGSTVTGYEYRLGAGGVWKPTGSLLSTFVVAGLSNATAYDVYVRSINAAGPSLASSVVSATPRTVPAAPAISTVALDTGAVSVSFTVGSDGGSPLTNVEYSVDGGNTWVTRSPVSTASPVTIGGLVGGETYPVRLRVVNVAGVSAASNTSSVTAKGRPDAPVISITGADRALVVTFVAPANGGTPIINYEYSVDDGITWWLRSPASISSPLVIGAVDNGTAYSTRLRAVNAVGSGTLSNSVIAVPRTVPGAPSISAETIVGIDGNLDVVFTAPTSDGGSAITTYQYSTDGGATWLTRQTGSTASPLRITTASSNGTTALTGGQVYPVEIRALNAAGAGVASDRKDGVTTTVPGAPAIVAVEPRDAAVSISFTPPTNGGSAITRFEYRLDLGTWIDTGSLAEEFIVGGLTNSVTYSLRVRAVNSVGDGPPSPAQPVQVFTTPGAPTLGATVPGDRALDVAFTAGDTGGSAIIGYQYSTDGGATWRIRASGTTASPLVITTESEAGGSMLTNATIYAVQLRAVNAAGPGAASETRLAAPRGAPSAPTGASLVAGNGTLVLTFAPGGDGGSPITAIEYQLDGGSWVDPGSLSSPLTIDELDNGRSYSVAVRARNAVGPGTASATSSGTPRTVPGAPTGVVVTSASHQVTATWLAPVSNGGAAVTGYTVSLYEQAAGGAAIATCTTGGALTCSVNGLTNGTTVYADVVAANAAGAGAASTPRLAQTPLVAPHVEIASISPGTNSLSVIVNIVDGGGSPITAYEYEFDGETWQSAPTATSPFTISGLTTGVEYSIRIRAIGAGGTGAPSSPMTAVPHTAPSAPTSLSATSAAASALLSWTAAADDGGQPVIDYVVQYSTNALGPFTTFNDGTATSPTATVTGLTNATAYFFRVAAVNTAGAGSWSALASATPLGAPSAPTITTITPGSSFLQVAFTGPSSNGGAVVTSYQYQLDNAGWHTTSATSSPLTITGLTNGQTYAVRVRAVNAVGGGAPSNSAPAKPYGLPGAIIGLRASPSTTSVTLAWDAVNDNGSPITAYNVIRWSAATEGTIATSFQTTATTQIFSGLTNGTYYFTVEATNAAGTGARSAPRTTAIVGSTVPSAVSAVSTSIEGTDASMAWTAGAEGSSAVSSFLVQYSTDDATWVTMSSGDIDVSASFDLPSASTLYALRVAAISAVGVGTFVTTRPPLAATGSVSGVGKTGATIVGSVNANSGVVGVAFEVATSVADLGSTASNMVGATPTPITGSANTAVSATLTGLQPGTSYIGRAVGTTATSVVSGATTTFTTNASIASGGLTPEYNGSPVAINTVTVPAGIELERTFEGIDDTVYPISSAPPTSAGTYRLTTIPAAGTFGGQEIVTLTIVPKPANVTVTIADRPFDGTTSAALTFELLGAVDGDDVHVDASLVSGVFDDSGAGVDKIVHVTSEPGWLTGLDAANYAPVITEETTATILQATQTLSFASVPPAPGTVGATYVPVAVSDMGLTPSLAVADGAGGTCSLSSGTVTLLSPGVCVLVANQDGTIDVEAAVAVEQSFLVVAAASDVEPVTLYLSLQVDVGDGVADGTILARGDGLMANSEVRIELHSTPVLLGTTTTDANGSFQTTVSMPPVVSAGTHHIVAIGIAPDDSSVTVSEEIFVDWSGSLGEIETVGGYTPLTATRILDTRDSGEGLTGATEFRLVVPASVVPSDVSALVLNLTVTQAARDGYVTIYPCGVTRPLAAAINFTAGETKANLVDALFRNGDILCLWSNVDTDVVVDLQGFHSRSGNGRLVPRDAFRLVDTRPADALVADQVLQIPVIGDGRARAGTTTVALNIAVDEPQRAGFLTVYPCGTDRPWVSNLNFAAGQTVSNEVMVEPGTDGMVCVYTTAATQLVVDLDATYDAAGTSRFTALVPGRLGDTRLTTKVLAGQSVEWTVVGDAGAAVGTNAVSLNIAVTEPEGAGYLTVYACGSAMPWASNLNFAAGQTISNHVTSSIGANGKICVYTSRTTNVVIDVEGTYSSV